MTALLSAAPAVATRDAAADLAVRIDGITKRFVVRRGMVDTLRRPFHREWQTALRGVTFDVRRGEFFGLLGPNGAGKTTLFKTLATLVLPDEGSATVEGHDVVREPAAVRRVLTPVVADERSLYWRLDARENLRLYATLYGLSRDEGERRVREVLHAVSLEDTGTKMVAKFSSGMRQRLLIARALLAKPRMLLLDEPTRSLDPVSARQFREFLRAEIIGRQGCTVLLATHNAEEALELCDRVGVLDKGRLLAVGTAEALAAEVGHEWYRVWTSGEARAAWEAMTRQGLVRLTREPGPAEDGWLRVEAEIPGGPASTARVVETLAREGVAVARLERISLSLADLIDRVVTLHGRATGPLGERAGEAHA